MYISFTTLVDSRDRYILVKQVPALDSFVVSLLIVCFFPFYIVIIMPSVVKGGGVVRKHMLSIGLTHVDICILRW